MQISIVQIFKSLSKILKLSRLNFLTTVQLKKKQMKLNLLGYISFHENY